MRAVSAASAPARVTARPRSAATWARQHQHCLVVLVICSCAVGLLWASARRDAEARLDRRLETSADRIAEVLADAFRRQGQLLQASRALIESSDRVTRDDWRKFVEALDLPAHAPGVHGIGYVERVDAAGMGAFIERVRADGAPDFSLRPHRDADRPGFGAVSYVIMYSEPQSRNRPAWGVDVATHTRNRQIYDESARTGRPQAELGFPLTQARGSGMIMVLPVPADAGRPQGWVTGSVVLEELIAGSWRPEWDGFTVTLGDPADGRELVRVTPGEHAADPEALGRRPDLVRVVDVFGRPVRLSLAPATGDLVHPETRDANVVLLVGAMATALLTLIVWSITRNRQHAVSIARQMTDSLRLSEQRQRELARRAEQANQAKSEFLANMSHEIRTPMTAILGYAELIDASDVDAATRAESVRAMRRAGRHLLNIINDVLDISKIESGHMEVRREPCGLPALVADVIAGLQPHAARKQLALSAEAAGPVPDTVVTDTHRVRQILINLVGNAIKFTDHGSVRVVVSHQAGRLAVRVEDTGPGIDPSKMETIFRPFEQGDNSSSRRHEGTGLGLAISRRLADLLGGSVEAESRPGRGSAFTLEIPAPAAPRAALTATLTQPDAAQDAGVVAPVRLCGRVLLAEDGPDNQRLISYVLRKAGLEVEVVPNGRRAVERIESGAPFDLLIADMQMPEMDGYTAAARLRQAGHTLPILALTAHAMSGDRERCLAAGCDEYESKPIDRVALLHKIARLLDPAARAQAA